MKFNSKKSLKCKVYWLCKKDKNMDRKIKIYTFSILIKEFFVGFEKIPKLKKHLKIDILHKICYN